MSIGTRIIQIRNHKGISQRQLSERSGIASSYLSRVENRRVEPQPKTLRKIAEALGVPVSEIFDERPGAAAVPQCSISVSGRCISELLTSGRRKLAPPGPESYSPRQLQLLRMSAYLIQTADSRLLDTLEMLLGALLGARGRKVRGLADPNAPKQKASEAGPGV
ncbi:MAG TPA: helix-turn-helix transcriptional regulator [Terriglobia bacterium]|nr:helix-turn-helix transcriptional regulator [Terriglobia bacterium]